MIKKLQNNNIIQIPNKLTRYFTSKFLHLNKRNYQGLQCIYRENEPELINNYCAYLVIETINQSNEKNKIMAKYIK